MNEGLAGGPREERPDDVCVDNVRERIALLGEPADVVSKGLARLLLAALGVPGVFDVHVHPLEVPNIDLLELCPATDVVGRQEFEPRSNVLPDTNGEILDDEKLIIRSSDPISEPEVFQPYNRVRLLGVFGDVGGWSEARWKRRFLDATNEGP
jgi:hypothetical protein